MEAFLTAVRESRFTPVCLKREGRPAEFACLPIAQYGAAMDSKHPVTLEDKKSARLLFRFQEMQEGGDLL